MQLQFEKRELSCLAQALRAVKDQDLTQEIRLSDDMPDAGRVLAGWGQVILRGKEWQDSHVAAAGGIQATVLYAPEDGSEPRKVDAWIPFQMKWDGAQTDREGPVRISALVRFVDGRNLSARKILIRVGLSCLAEALVPRREEVYTPRDVPADVELLRRNYPVRLPREAGEKTFTLEEPVPMDVNPVRELIACTLQPEVSEAKVSGGHVALRGTGKLHLIYRCPEGRIRVRDMDFPFSQLAELERGYDNDARADVMMAVTGLELDMEGETLTLRCGLTAQYQVTDRTMLELVEDAYSPRREVAIRQEELHLPVLLDETAERITAQAQLPGMGPEAVDLVFWPGFPRARRGESCVEMELCGRFQILEYDAQGSLQAAMIPWEGKTSLPADAASSVEAMLRPAGLPQWNPGGQEMRAEAQLQITSRSGCGMPMITGLECGELRSPEQERPSLILCRPGKRILWQIAKDSGSSVSAIREANGFDGEPDGNRLLLIPVQ